MIAVTPDFAELYSVGAGDLLLCVNGLSTPLISSSALEKLLYAGLNSFEVVSQESFEANNQAAATATATAAAATAAAAAAAAAAATAARPPTRSKEQLSLNRHGFYAKGTY